MSHVLLGGNNKYSGEICGLLVQWGYTVSKLDAEVLALGEISVHECDVLLLVGENNFADQIEMLPEIQHPIAPWLLFDCQQPAWLSDDQIFAKVDSTKSTEKLRLELEACCDSVSELRGSCDEIHQYNNYVQFLGHELRSPLTAVKTALEVLHGDMGGLGSQAPDVDDSTVDPNFRILELALRNVRRLHRTVEWSQDLLALMQAAPPSVCQTVSVKEIIARLGESELCVEPGLSNKTMLETDPELLSALLEQLIRVMDYVFPAEEAKLRLEKIDNNIMWQVFVKDDQQKTHNRSPVKIAKTHLVTPANSLENLESETLQRLSGFMVSKQLLAVLGVSMSVVENVDNEYGLVLKVPVVAKNCAKMSDEIKTYNA